MWCVFLRTGGYAKVCMCVEYVLDGSGTGGRLVAEGR